MQTTPNSIKRYSRTRVAVATVTGAAGAASVVAVLWHAAADTGVRALAGAPIAADEALVGVLAAVGLVLVGWLVLGVALEVLALVPGAVGRGAARASAALSPRVARRVVAVVVGLGVTAGATGTAHAAPLRVAVATAESRATDLVHDRAAAAGGPAGAAGWTTAATAGWTTAATAGWTSPAAAPGVAAGDPDPGWTPERPRVRPQPDLAPLGTRSPGSDADPTVVVRRGDSLWTIAARHLGAYATDAEIAAEWPRWYAENRAAVGDDPDLLLPGVLLRAPQAMAS
ncbi:hypothetical protein KC207_11370 [Phycicoccus sp. BSK3Z-2]|uniref:LysM domain-containing protein n=1 Tax=Phycicoccus avicenniae TaxID=2828860 RepID=A0A941D8U3_9MICO|nr:hypothetical protein [Phycicoccus avicenniae]MBR7743890.1 hypothetical protein [Phycicoccus avicenniae]